jgi:dienelactone hydrolase
MRVPGEKVVGSGKTAIVIIHDVFGLHTGRHKQIADEFAAAGYYVVVPDFYNTAQTGGGLYGKEEYGYGFGSLSNMTLTRKILSSLFGGGMAAYFKLTPWAHCKGIYEGKVTPYLNGKGVSKIAVVGFCWGAWVGYHIAADGNKVVANVAIHPSVDMAAVTFKEDEDQLVSDASKVPTLVCSTSLEPATWQPGGKANQTMEAAATKLGKDPKKHILWQHYPNQLHGFMTRGTMRGDLELAKDVKKIFEETCAFVNEQ